MTASSSRITVVIATYNRAALLDDCLAHLKTQRFLPGDAVLIVDNGSADDTAAVVARHQREWTAPLRLLREPRPGKSHAVARGVAGASGDILAFTDDDVNVGKEWLDAIRGAMADPAVALAGGPVVARWEPSVPAWVRAARDRQPSLGAPIALVDYGDRAIALGERTLLGANSKPPRRVHPRRRLPPPRKAAAPCRAKTELCRRVQAAAFSRCMRPARSCTIGRRLIARVSYFLRWFFWSGITHAIMTPTAPRPLDEPLAVRVSATAGVGLPACLPDDRAPDRCPHTRHRRRLRRRIRLRALGVREPGRPHTGACRRSRVKVASATVLICTYNRARLLRETLASLQAMAPADAVRVEIIVVDNNSTDNTQLVIAEAQRASAIPVIGLRETRQGKSFALNRGLEAATGDIVALTDDDVWPDGAAEPYRLGVSRARRDLRLRQGAPRWSTVPPELLSRRHRTSGAARDVDYGDAPVVRGGQHRQRLPIGATPRSRAKRLSPSADGTDPAR